MVNVNLTNFSHRGNLRSFRLITMCNIVITLFLEKESQNGHCIAQTFHTKLYNICNISLTARGAGRSGSATGRVVNSPCQDPIKNIICHPE